MSSQRLLNKVCVVTGAASGIGRACAVRFAHEGGKVVLADINVEAGEAAAAAIRAAGGQAIFQPTDVGDAAQIDALLQCAVATFGGVHLWHNNAFWSVFKPISEQTLAEFDRTVQISLRAYWYGAKVAATYMLAHEGGLILNTASVQSYFGEPGFSAYQACKGAVLNMSRAIGVECAPKVRCVALAPGLVLTPVNAALPAATLERVKAQIPAGRGCTPEEVAALAAFLASEEADYITATGIVMDGGYLAM